MFVSTFLLGPWARILWWGLYDNLCVLLSYVQLEENIWKQIRIKNIKNRLGSHIWSCDRLWDIRLNETDYINTRVFWTINWGPHRPPEASSLILLCLLKNLQNGPLNANWQLYFVIFCIWTTSKFSLFSLCINFTVKGVSEQTDSRGAAGSHTLHLCLHHSL